MAEGFKLKQQRPEIGAGSGLGRGSSFGPRSRRLKRIQGKLRRLARTSSLRTKRIVIEAEKPNNMHFILDGKQIRCEQVGFLVDRFSSLPVLHFAVLSLAGCSVHAEGLTLLFDEYVEEIGLYTIQCVARNM